MNRPYVISVIGQSKSGKTRFIEKLIPILKERGYKVGAIKHTHHEFEIDYPGKDSYRMLKSGADCVVIFSNKKIAMIRNTNHLKNINLNEVIKWLFPDYDIILVEGAKNQTYDKIEISSEKFPDEEEVANNIEKILKQGLI